MNPRIDHTHSELQAYLGYKANFCLKQTNGKNKFSSKSWMWRCVPVILVPGRLKQETVSSRAALATQGVLDKPGLYSKVLSQKARCWRHGSAAKSMYCSCGGPEIGSRNQLIGSSQLLVTPAPGDLSLSFGL